MHATLSAFVISLAVSAPAERPEPQPLLGDALLPGAVARLGPTAFYYAGWVPSSYSGTAGPVCYSPDGKRVAVTSTTGVYVWDVATGKRLVWIPTDGKASATLLGFHTNGDIFVTCWRVWDHGGAGVFRIDPVTGKVKTKFQPDDTRRFGPVTPDGKIVFSRTASGNVSTDETVANDPDTGKELWRRKHPDMSWMRLSPDGSRLVAWSSWAKWSADVLDTATGKTVERFVHPEYGCTPYSLAVGPKAEWVVSAHAWDRGFTVFKSGEEKPFLHEKGMWYTQAFLTPDGKRAVFIRNPRGYEVEVWDIAAKKKLSSAETTASGTATLAPDGKTLAVAGDRGNPHALQFFDTATGKRLPLSPEPFAQAAVVWYQPDGTLASADEKLAKPVSWNLKTGAMTALPVGTKPPAPPKKPDGFKPPEGTVNVAASPDGKRAIGYRFDPEELDSAPGDTYLGLFDAGGKLVKWYPRPDHTGGATYAFAPDGKTFALARGDGTITLFDAEEGAELRTFRNAGGVGSMAFSPDGRYLATTGGDGPILVWDLKAAKK